MPTVTTAQFSTDAIEPALRFEAWRQVVGVSHEVNANPDGFSGSVVSTRFDGMIVHVMQASDQGTMRDDHRVRRDGLEHLVLYLNAAPTKALIDDGELRIPAYGISINDLSHSSQRSIVPERNSIIISMSRELVMQARGFTDGLHGTIVERGSGALLGAHLRNLALHAATIEQSASAAVARGTAELLVACLAPSRDNLERARSTVETAALSRARRYVEYHLADLALTPDTLGAAIGVSRSTLFRLFEPFGGVVRYINTQRLRAARRELSDPRKRSRISVVARHHGFASEARFSREFKRAFGISPSDFANGGVGAESGIDAASSEDLPGAHFADWVRDLG